MFIFGCLLFFSAYVHLIFYHFSSVSVSQKCNETGPINWCVSSACISVCLSVFLVLSLAHCLFLFNLVYCIIVHFPDNQIIPGNDYCTLNFRFSWMSETRFPLIVSIVAFCLGISHYFKLAGPMKFCNCSCVPYICLTIYLAKLLRFSESLNV